MATEIQTNSETDDLTYYPPVDPDGQSTRAENVALADPVSPGVGEQAPAPADSSR